MASALGGAAALAPAAFAVPAGQQVPAGADPEALYREGRTFAQFLESARRQRRAWHRNYERGLPAPEATSRAAALDRPVRLLVVAEDWCGDSLNTLPYLARLVEAVPALEMRVIDSGTGAALMRQHLTPDGRAATPTVLFLDEQGREIGAWVERPAVLQEWFLSNEEVLSRDDLYEQKYAWYDEDRGRTTVSDVLDLLLGAPAPAARGTGQDLETEPQNSGVTALLQAISPVSEQVVWVSGHAGTWARTLDGGATWHSGGVQGGEALQFRDVHAVSAEEAWLLSAGSGEASRIYHTDDGGTSWTLQFLNRQPDAFFDCLAFWDARRGAAFSDSVDGRFVILVTEDGGSTWDQVPAASLPPAQPGEGSFAASGTCLVTGARGMAWIGTGAATTARVLRTDDWGHTWVAVDTPVHAAAAAGLASLTFRDDDTGLALGGDIGDPSSFTDNVAVTHDAGATWALAGRPTFPGAVYGAAYVPELGAAVAVGPGGISWSSDDGANWRPVAQDAHWAVAFASARIGWAVGPQGRITALRPHWSGPQ